MDKARPTTEIRLLTALIEACENWAKRELPIYELTDLAARVGPLIRDELVDLLSAYTELALGIDPAEGHLRVHQELVNDCQDLQHAMKQLSGVMEIDQQRANLQKELMLKMAQCAKYELAIRGLTAKRIWKREQDGAWAEGAKQLYGVLQRVRDKLRAEGREVPDDAEFLDLWLEAGGDPEKAAERQANNDSQGTGEAAAGDSGGERVQ